MSKIVTCTLLACCIILVVGCSSPIDTPEKARSLSGPKLVSIWNQTKDMTNSHDVNFTVGEEIDFRGRTLDGLLKAAGLPCSRAFGCMASHYPGGGNTAFNRALLQAGAWSYVKKTGQDKYGASTMVHYTVTDPQAFRAVVRKVLR